MSDHVWRPAIPVQHTGGASKQTAMQAVTSEHLRRFPSSSANFLNCRWIEGHLRCEVGEVEVRVLENLHHAVLLLVVTSPTKEGHKRLLRAGFTADSVIIA